MSFRALVLEQKENGDSVVGIKVVSLKELQQEEGEVLVKVAYSTLNYKDALAITGTGKIARRFPMIAGIDAVGEVIQDQSGYFKKGDRVLINGNGLGETHWGGLSDYIFVKSKWLIDLPDNLSEWDTMALGTAGYTAALCVQRLLQHGIKPDRGDILVSGATGGVGLVAVYLLSQLGFSVTALTSKVDETEFFNKLGAQAIEAAQPYYEAGRPLKKARWQAAVDVVGSHTLANIASEIEYGGAITACGLAQGMDFPGNVAPFILRGVTLYGIDSVYAPMERREKAWELLNEYMTTPFLSDYATTISLDESIEIAEKMMQGAIKGRFVVDLSKK